jgi:hypothetical protein
MPTRPAVLGALIAFTTLASPALAGKKDKVDPDHQNHFKEAEGVSGDVRVALSDIVATDAEAKMKVRFHNGTADWLLVKTDESRFNIAGRDREPTRARMLLVEPKSDGTRIVATTGSGLHQDTMAYVPNGLYRVPKDAPTRPAADFQLPLTSPDVEAGSFNCTVPGKIKKETDETKVKFKCRYEGDAIGIVDPKQIQIRLEDGQVFANDDRQMDPEIVLPGDEFKFDAVFHVSAKITDMQFATMHIVFNDTFKEGQPEAVPFDPIPIVLDPGMTAAQN